MDVMHHGKKTKVLSKVLNGCDGQEVLPREQIVL